MQFDVWQFTLILDWSIWLLVLQVNEPLTFSRGQYLQDDVRLHGLVSIRLNGFSVLVLELVEARTKWSERFLFRRRPKMISESKSGLEVLDLPRISQLLVIISLFTVFQTQVVAHTAGKHHLPFSPLFSYLGPGYASTDVLPAYKFMIYL